MADGLRAPVVFRLDDEERDLLARRRPGLGSGTRWLVADAGPEGQAQALLGAIAELQDARTGPADGVDLVLRLGGRELVFEVRSVDGTVLVEDQPAGRVAAEIDLAERLRTDPRLLARARATVDEAWERLAETWGYRNDYEVASRLGYAGGRPAAFVTGLVRERRLLGARRRGHRLFPGFQFADDSRPVEALPEVLGALPARWTNLEKVLWFDSPNGWLPDGARPAEVLAGDPAPVVRAAGYAAVGEY